MGLGTVVGLAIGLGVGTVVGRVGAAVGAILGSVEGAGVGSTPYHWHTQQRKEKVMKIIVKTKQKTLLRIKHIVLMILQLIKHA